WDLVKHAVDIEPLYQYRAAMTYLAAPLPIPSELSAAWATPGLSMVTLDDLRLRRDTPLDTLDTVNVNAILPQLVGVRELLSRAWADPKFVGPAELRRQVVRFSGQVVSPAVGKPVPDLPREGFLA